MFLGFSGNHNVLYKLSLLLAYEAILGGESNAWVSPCVLFLWKHKTSNLAQKFFPGQSYHPWFWDCRGAFSSDAFFFVCPNIWDGQDKKLKKIWNDDTLFHVSTPDYKLGPAKPNVAQQLCMAAWKSLDSSLVLIPAWYEKTEGTGWASDGQPIMANSVIW